MSVENVKAFIEKIKDDKELQEKMKALSKDNAEARLEQLIQIAREAGFAFTVEEYKEALTVGFKEDYITEAELEQIAGGWFVNTMQRGCKFS